MRSPISSLPLLTFVVAVLATFTSVSAQTDIDLTRTNLWPRITAIGNFGESSWGYFALADLRYNFGFSKEVDGVEVSDAPLKTWQSQVVIGPQWSTKLGGKSPFSIRALYHGTWYIENPITPEMYYRHSVEMRFDLVQPIKRNSIKYRVFPYIWFPQEVESGNNLTTEFLTRFLVGGIFPINKKFQIIADEEIFIKWTADKNDHDGTNVFNKNALWLGLQWKPSKLITVKLQYVNMITFLVDTEVKTMTPVDHNIMTQVVFRPIHSKKTKR